MFKQNLIRGLTKMSSLLKKHSPIILTAIGVVGFIGSTVTAVKSVPKVNLVIQEKEEEKGESLTKKEEIFTKAKIYLPTIILIITSTMCVVGSVYIGYKRSIALGTALMASREAMKEYKSSVISEIGEKKAKEIDKKVIENRIQKSEFGNINIIETGDGDIIFYEPLSDRYFKSRKTAIEAVENAINSELLDSNWVYLNDMYESLNLSHIGLGERIGWAYEFSGLLHITIEAIDSPWGEPIYALQYSEDPFYDNRWC